MILRVMVLIVSFGLLSSFLLSPKKEKTPTPTTEAGKFSFRVIVGLLM